ncbi:MAG: hypothetical protein WCC60_06895 [Ilumatobacteraceae bacterium]
MKRPLALSLGALVAVLSFSSCSSVDHADVVAQVNGHELTSDQLSALAGDTTEGAGIRQTLTTWIEVVAVTDDASGLTTAADLSAKKAGLFQSLLGQFTDAGRTTYELGLDGSPLLCLSAIPLDTTVPTQQVLDELAAGTSFADAAGTYSIDDALAESGGVVANVDGAECLESTSFNAALIQALADAGAVVGTPTAVELQGQPVIILLRPYDELTLTDDQELRLSANELGAVLRDKYDAADIEIDARVGKWDAAQGQVVAVGANPATRPTTAGDAPTATG